MGSRSKLIVDAQGDFLNNHSVFAVIMELFGVGWAGLFGQI